MRASALEKRFVPLRDTAPKYEVARLRAEARAGELAGRPAPGETRAGDATASPYGYELRVESADGLIVGRIDRALATEHGTVLQDYKSGAIFSLHEGDVRQIKPEYALQLRLYAALYFEATGTWPVRLELVPLAGDPQEVSFSEEECLKLLDHAKAILAAVNQQLARVSEGWDAVEASLATPSAAACRFCSFRPACSPYLSTEHAAGDREWPADVSGSFQSLTKLGNGRLILRVARNDGTHFFVRDLPEQLAAEAMASAREGILVGAFNLRRTGSPQAFESGALTTLYCQPADKSRGKM